jgi:hypothetical protein
MQCNAVQYNVVQRSKAQHSTTQRNTTHHNTTQYNTKQYNTNNTASIFELLDIFSGIHLINCEHNYKKKTIYFLLLKSHMSLMVNVPL